MRAAALCVSADEAIAAIPSGATVAVGGFVGAGQGDRGERGLNHLAPASSPAPPWVVIQPRWVSAQSMQFDGCVRRPAEGWMK